MADEQALNHCGCCEGVARLTPDDLANPPGLAALAYRIGTHGSFKASMLAGLAGSRGVPALTTRADDDPAIALIDATAVMLDVLSFYQERIANEGFLRTATERLSVLELARTIGYKLRPGVAASTYLVFEMETTPAAPASAIVPQGTKVQSVPGQDEKPQTFETIEPIEARRDWNKLRIRMSKPQSFSLGGQLLYLEGVTTNLRPGDALLIVGDERLEKDDNENWDFRHVQTLEHVIPADRPSYTVVRLDRGLGSFVPTVVPTQKHPRAYVLRQRANFFGHNAPDWRAMPKEVKAGFLDPSDTTQQTDWPRFTLKGITPETGKPDEHNLHLDAIYERIVPDSWIVVSIPPYRSIPPYQELYRISAVTEDARNDFTLSTKTSRLTVRGENLEKFNECVRNAVIFAQSEELVLAEVPIVEPVANDHIVFDLLLPDLPPGRTLIVSGKRVRVKALNVAIITASDGVTTARLLVGDSLVLEATPQDLPSGHQIWHLLDKNGFSGTISFASAALAKRAFKILPAEADDAAVSEIAVIKEVKAGSDPTEIHLAAPLLRTYDRETVVIYANVAAATHGETRREVLGSGDAARSFQTFALKQKPLTYTVAATASGSATTLQVRVNDVLWQEWPALYKLSPREHAYITCQDDDGVVHVTFGDGTSGARLPSGNENIVATYRSGIGAAGMLKPGQLSLLMTRPIGVRKVTNPLAPTGAADPETRDQARQNAPFTVLTLDRIVALRDFEDFARTFAGIGKAQATWLWDGEVRLVHVTIAAATDNGVDFTIDPRSVLFNNLQLAMDAARDTVQRLILASYEQLFFRLKASLLINPAYSADRVLEAARAALLRAYAFEQRDFGQPVYQGEVQSVLQATPGVMAVFLDHLYLRGASAEPNDVLTSAPARRDPSPRSVAIKPAQLLLLDPLGVDVSEVKL